MSASAKSLDPMRISGPNANAAPATAATARPAPRRAFALGESNASRAASASVALRTVGGIDALVVLQGLEHPAERRKLAVKRSRMALDALDELKIGLLNGNLSAATLSRLQSAAGFLKGSAGDEALDGVISEIGLRVEVEIAKMAAR